MEEIGLFGLGILWHNQQSSGFLLALCSGIALGSVWQGEVRGCVVLGINQVSNMQENDLILELIHHIYPYSSNFGSEALRIWLLRQIASQFLIAFRLPRSFRMIFFLQHRKSVKVQAIRFIFTRSKSNTNDHDSRRPLDSNSQALWAWAELIFTLPCMALHKACDVLDWDNEDPLSSGPALLYFLVWKFGFWSPSVLANVFNQAKCLCCHERS